MVPPGRDDRGTHQALPSCLRIQRLSWILLKKKDDLFNYFVSALDELNKEAAEDAIRPKRAKREAAAVQDER